MKHPEIIDILSSNLQKKSSGKALIHRVQDSKKWLIVQPWLGATTESSNMTQTMVSKLKWRCNLVLADHPHWWVNATMDHPEDFTLDVCREHTKHLIRHVLSLHGVEKVILLGTSLGFWTLDQASREISDTHIKMLFGKSGIASYQKIAQRLWGVNNILRNVIRIDENGWWKIQVNERDAPIKLHRNFIEWIPHTPENEIPQCHPLQVVHATNDIWTPYDEMREHIGHTWVIFTRNDGHGMNSTDGVNVDDQIANIMAEELDLQL